MEQLIKKDGYAFAFNQSACANCEGRCCIGESGYIWVNSTEQQAIAKHLNLTLETFAHTYLEKIRYRFTIKELAYEGGFSCVFFDLHKKICKIYPVRPQQCRTFPFWEHFKENINEVEKECPGIIRF